MLRSDETKDVLQQEEFRCRAVLFNIMSLVRANRLEDARLLLSEHETMIETLSQQQRPGSFQNAKTNTASLPPKGETKKAKEGGEGGKEKDCCSTTVCRRPSASRLLSVTTDIEERAESGDTPGAVGAGREAEAEAEAEEGRQQKEELVTWEAAGEKRQRRGCRKRKGGAKVEHSGQNGGTNVASGSVSSSAAGPSSPAPPAFQSHGEAECGCKGPHRSLDEFPLHGTCMDERSAGRERTAVTVGRIGVWRHVVEWVWRERCALETSGRPSVCVSICLLLFVVLSFLPLLPGAFFREFLMDDSVAVLRNPDVFSPPEVFSFWGGLMKHDFWGSDMFDGSWTHKSFRPLTTLSYRWNYLVHGFDSSGFHLTNFASHLVVVCLLCLTAWRVLGLPPLASVVSAGLFAVHPVHTESVHYLVGRADILAAIFFLFAILWYSEAIRREYGERGEGGSKRKTGTGARWSEFLSIGERQTNRRFEVQRGKKGGGWRSSVVPVGGGLVFATLSGLCKESGFTVLGVLFGMEGLYLLERLLGRRPTTPPKETERERENEFIRKSNGEAESSVSSCSLKEGSEGSRQNDTNTDASLSATVCFSVARLVFLAVLTLIAVKIRFAYTKGTGLKMSPQDNPVDFEESLLIRVLSYALIQGIYLRLLVLPFNLCYDYSLNAVPLVGSFRDVRLLLPLCGYCLLASGVCVGLKWLYIERGSGRGKQKGEERGQEQTEKGKGSGLLVSLGVMLLSFFPASNVFFPVGTVVGERLLYIPSLGFCMALGCLLSAFSGDPQGQDLDGSEERQGEGENESRLGSEKKSGEAWTHKGKQQSSKHAPSPLGKKDWTCGEGDGGRMSIIETLGFRNTVTVYGVALLVWAVWGCACFFRTLEWRDAATLFKADGRRQLTSAKTQFNLGITFMMERNFPEAREALVRSLMADPLSVLPYWRLGQIEIIQGNYEEAHGWLSQALNKYGGTFVVREEEVLNDAAVAAWQTGRRDEAVRFLEAALALNPSFAKGWNNIACATVSKDRVASLEMMRRAAGIGGRHALYLSNLAFLLLLSGRRQEAEQAWHRSKRVAAELGLVEQPMAAPSDCAWEFFPAE